MKDFESLLLNEKHLTLTTVRVLYEEGLSEVESIGKIRKIHNVDMSQETIRRFYNRFLREDLKADDRMHLLLEFSAG